MKTKNIWNKIYNIACFVLLFAAIAYCKSYYNQHDQNKIHEQTIQAYRDSVRTLQLKNGELISAKYSYILEIEELETQFDLSKKEVKDLQKKLKSNLAYISKIESKVILDTIYMVKDSIIYRTDGIDATFGYKDNWLSLNGVTSIQNNTSTTKLFDIQMYTPLKVGLTNDYQIFVQSDNPYLNITDIQGAAINKSILVPKKKRFGFGIQAGFGAMYDITNKKAALGPYMGAGVHYNF